MTLALRSLLRSAVIWASLLPIVSLAQLPEGFDYTLLSDEIPGVVTLDFAANGNIYACDFYGRIWLFQDGELQPEPIIDISEEVMGYNELGCLSFALHPDFMLNGYIYLFYAVDRHHLLHYGTDEYDPNANEYNSATIGRLSRFQLQLSDYQTLIDGSRTVLFGEEIGEGNASLTASHGTGDMVFGTDGTLLISTGDGNTWEAFFAGGEQELPGYAYDDQGLSDGIITSEENVGAFRAQQLESYNGKILRIDAMTGAGVPGNPYYDAENPQSARSKIWALGLRNPYRMTLRPGTGSTNPADGQPGSLYISDVGYNEWEEINVADGPGYNFGWPVYEGMTKNPGYYNKIRKNRFQSNPYVSNGCAFDYFSFQQLIQQENASIDYFYPNPCNIASDIADYADVFTLTRPVLAYRNTAQEDNAPPQIPGFASDGSAIGLNINDADQEIEQAASFNGIASMVGDFYSGSTYPEAYQGILPVLDYTGWLKVFWFNNNHELTKMEHWMSGLENVVDMRYNPHDECYYTVGMFPSQIHRLCFSGNLQPVVEASATPRYGPTPLEVTFDAGSTYDPEGDPLTFHWAFGDGTSSEEIVTTHVYAGTSGPAVYDATLTVQDTADNEVIVDFLISPNNTPPEVNIEIADGTLYPMGEASAFPMSAAVYDTEHESGELEYHWRTFLHHNTHFHPLSESASTSDVFLANPVGCGPIDSYHYRISLKVTDPMGLIGYDEVFLYPDCNQTLPEDPYPGDDAIVIFPNPANDIINIRFREITVSTPVKIGVYDLMGRLLQEDQYILDENLTFIGVRTSALAQGQYVLKISGLQQTYLRHLVVAR